MASSMFDFPEAGRVYSLLVGVADNAKSDIDDLRSRHPDWHQDTDIRISGFGKLSNAHGATALGIKLYADCLLDSAWWERHSSSYSSEDRWRRNRAFIDLQKFGLIQLGFVSIESTLREILRAVDPSACNGATDPFKNVYECLIRTKLRGVNVGGCDLLDLMREIRNTSHNNGVYFSKRAVNVPVTYKRNTYDFLHGQKVDFITWDLLADLHEDARILLREIVDHPAVSGIAGTITDPYA